MTYRIARESFTQGDAAMEPMIVSNQAQYDEAHKLYQDLRDTSCFNIDTGKGIEIIREVDYLLHNYLYKDVTKEETENALSSFFFTEYQAQNITGYFSALRPNDLYDIQQGLNVLGLRCRRELNVYSSLIHIKNGTETINVQCPVEVFDTSAVSAVRHAIVTAHDSSTIKAYDRSIVHSFDTSAVTAFDQSHIVVKNKGSVTLYHHATAASYNNARVTARDHSIATAYDQAQALIFDDAFINGYNGAFITGKDNSRINAWDESTVKAFDNCRVNANHDSYVAAHDYASVHAQDNAVVIADTKAQVTARHRSLVFLKDDALCNCNDTAKLIVSSRNDPAFLKRNVFYILDHPFVNRSPTIAVNLLYVSTNKNNRDGYLVKLKEMGCVSPESTKKVLNALLGEYIYQRHKAKEPEESWER
jgi:hypothetical protein